MPLFKCDECGALENTALGFYWPRNEIGWADERLNGKALCSECMPAEFDDGSPNPGGGTWHGRFPKRTPEEAGYVEGCDGFYRRDSDGPDAAPR